MARVKTGLSKKLLTRVLSVYFILTLIVTVGQVFTEYFATKRNIESELRTLRNTFAVSLTRAIWELNLDQAGLIADGLMELPIVEGVLIRDESGEVIKRLPLDDPPPPPTDLAMSSQMFDFPGGKFGYSFPLIFEFSGRTSPVGDVTLYSSIDIIVDRIEIGIFFLIGNAIIKTTFLVFLFMTAFRRMLSEPLDVITQQMLDFDPVHPQDSKIAFRVEDDNELRQLTESYNQVIDDLIVSQKKLTGAQDELRQANQKLDDQNLLLEQEVAKKTASLSQIMLDLEQQKDELLANQRELKQENENRQYIEDELRRKNSELADSMESLKMAKDQLVESERMASLGGLVAGIAHDVNTPIGVSVTAASFLQERIHSLEKDYTDSALTKSAMKLFIEEAEQTTQLLLKNLYRASELIASFKQVAVDQTSEAERNLNLKDYLQEILQSLKPTLKQSNHNISINCDADLEVFCAPGVIAQVVTNMLMNSVIHGYDEGVSGNISLDVSVDDNYVELIYKDDGKGMDENDLNRLFDAFFTTRPTQGGTGLGTHIMYNLVTQALKGQIDAFSRPGEGLRYEIRFPRRT